MQLTCRFSIFFILSYLRSSAFGDSRPLAKLIQEKRNKTLSNRFLFLLIWIVFILLSFSKIEVYARNNTESRTGVHIGNIPLKVTPARVNSTRDLDDKDPGDGKCFTGEKNNAGEPECTLRAFIQEANKRKGKNIIRIFDIPLGDPGYNRDTQIHTIRPRKPLRIEK